VQQLLSETAANLGRYYMLSLVGIRIDDGARA